MPLLTPGYKGEFNGKRHPRSNKADVAHQVLVSCLSTAGYKNISLNFHENPIMQRFTVIGLLAHPL